MVNKIVTLVLALISIYLSIFYGTKEEFDKWIIVTAVVVLALISIWMVALIVILTIKAKSKDNQSIYVKYQREIDQVTNMIKELTDSSSQQELSMLCFQIRNVFEKILKTKQVAVTLKILISKQRVNWEITNSILDVVCHDEESKREATKLVTAADIIGRETGYFIGTFCRDVESALEKGRMNIDQVKIPLVKDYSYMDVILKDKEGTAEEKKDVKPWLVGECFYCPDINMEGYRHPALKCANVLKKNRPWWKKSILEFFFRNDICHKCVVAAPVMIGNEDENQYLRYILVVDSKKSKVLDVQHIDIIKKFANAFGERGQELLMIENNSKRNYA